jgi:transcription antitermination protein NusB
MVTGSRDGESGAPRSTMANRRKSRELALQVMYAREIGCHNEPGDVETLAVHIAEENACDEGVRTYGLALVHKALAAQAEIDAQIQAHAANWELKRMAAIDRNILRLSVAEMRFFPDVPVKVVIDEAIELAKLYGAEDSGKFVNGVIDSIRKELQQQPL